ncbi:MAG: S8 family serine peptidase, partial [Saprospiraceae bacterium]
MSYVPQEVLVKWKARTSAAEISNLSQSLKAIQTQYFKNVNIEVWSIPADVNVLDLIKKYQDYPNIEFISPNYIYSANAFIPNDFQFDNQWNMANIGQTGGSIGADVGMINAWDIQRKSPNVKVAIIDAGIDWKHPDLVENIWQNLGEDADGDGQVLEWNGIEWVLDPGDENNIDDDGNGYVDDFIGWDFVNNDNDPYDDNFHGTHAAGVIGAKGNNGIGIAGITWDVQMAALKFLDVDMLGTTANAIAAINYAVAANMHISNNSWGGNAYDPALYAAIQQAANQNHLFIAAAGNNGENADQLPIYPAAYNLPNIISVASTNHQDSLSSFSNYGANTVDLAAPGSQILSCFPNNSYTTISGTSMAAPHVTGACALLLGQNPNKTNAIIKSDLLSSVDVIAALTNKTVSNGRLNVCKLLGGCAIENLSCAYTDSLALVELYNATDGPNWTISWDLNQPMNTWHGITTNETGCVTNITLVSNQLTGSIPAEIGNLTHLKELFLAVNQLTGSIPPQIGNLFNLLKLSLYHNQLTGTLPSELGNLENLRELHLSNNQLIGNIPEEIANLSKAKSIHLNSNQLTGSIPFKIGKLTNLTYLSLGRNLLNGSIPKEIGDMTCLESLSLVTNELMGEIPSELGKLTNLKQLSLSNNKLTGNIPSELSKLTQIKDLLLSHNELTGSIPPELGNLDVLERLLLHKNQLSGCFSPQLASFCGINYNFSDNPNLPNSGYFIDFCETRTGLCACSSNTDSLTLVELYLNTAGENWLNTWDLETSIDTWYGITTNDDGCVSGINLANNGLEGTIPENLAHLTALESIEVQNNQLNGCFPSTLTNFCTITVDFSNNPDLPGNGNFSTFCTNQIGSCITCDNAMDSLALVDFFNATNGPNWTTTWNLNAPLSTWHGIRTNSSGCVIAIELNSNQLIGTIPSSIGNLLTLQILNLANNQLIGDIPIEIYNLTNLHTLYLLNNSFTGSISPTISNLKQLERLNLHNNELSNSIPLEIGKLRELQILVLSNNDLMGSIPTEITQLTKLRRLELSFNQLTGKIPTNIGELKNLTELRIGTNQLTDSIPASIGDLSNLQMLSLGTNQLSGPIPSNIGNLKILKYLLLQGNQLTDNIPVEVGMLKKLELLYLNDNQLTGSIPSTISDLSNLNYLILNNNQLSGCFPSSFKHFCDITAYDFSDNPNLPNGGDFDTFCETGAGSCASTDLVWPGDFNNDGVANYTDVLYWGLACKGVPGPV